MKMIEATNLKTIDDIINQVEKIEVRKEAPISKQVEKQIEKTVEIVEPKVVEIPVEKVEEKIVFEEPETRIEEVTPFDEVLIQNTTFVDLSTIDAIEVVDYSTPFDDLPTEQPIKQVAPIVQEPEIKIEPIVETQVEANIFEEVQIIPIEDPFEEDDISTELYEQLTAKVYDRDYSLGECFEKNFIFNGFENNKLYITSYAQDEDRKFLYKHFGIIKTFAQDIFGNDVELDFKKEEPSVLEDKKEEETKPDLVPLEDEISNDIGSMIEDVEMGSGCVADMHKSEVTQVSQQELQLNDILNSKMLDKAKELFDIKKITVKSRS